MARDGWNLTEEERITRNRKFDPSRIYLAEVMDTRSVTKAGELKVWILNSGLNRDDSEKWVTCSYCSSFFGTTPYFKNSSPMFENSPKSFGSWFPIPCEGNFVFIFYACMYGENVQPFWFGCPVDCDLNYMIPGIPASFTSDDKKALCELNDKNIEESYTLRGTPLSTKELNQAEYTPLNEALKRQGLENDKLRGYSTSGSKRETPSMCYGFLTPLGNSFVMDDGWEETDNKQDWNIENSYIDDSIYNQNNTNRKNAGFRFRTRNGTQILISDNGNIYMINRDGTAWAEITDDGRLQGYAQNSVDIASDGDINFKSKRKFFVEADEGFAFKSKKGMSIELEGDINISSPHINTDTILNVEEINSKLGNIESFESKMAQCNGVFSGTLQGTALYATHAGLLQIKQPDPIVEEVNLPKVLLEEVKEIVGQAGETQESINTAVPTAEPYDGHNRNDMMGDLIVERKLNNEYNYIPTPIVTNQVNQTAIPQEPNKVDTQCLITDIQLTEHFNLRQLCASSTADRLKINNNPTNQSIIDNLKALAENILEKVWQHYGTVTINSGYRGPALNTAIGGAKTSQHRLGLACDFEIIGVDNYDLALWCKDNLNYDQLILEFATGGGNNGWVHCSYNGSKNRKQLLTINKSGTRVGLYR